MLLSEARCAALASSILLLQAVIAAPTAAAEPQPPAEEAGSAEPQTEPTAPLDSTALGEVTSLISNDVPPSSPRGKSGRPGFSPETNGNSSQVAPGPKAELQRTPTGAPDALSEFMQSGSLGVAGSSQDATNVTMGVSLNGTTSVTYIKQ